MSPRALAARLAAALCVTTADALAGGTHCLPAETVAFSCSMAGGKVLSVCLAASSGTTPAAVGYRFGRLGAPEFVFPETAPGSSTRFRFAHYVRYRVDRTELSFSNAGAAYSVFAYYEGEAKPAFARGVRVTANGREREMLCRPGAVARLGVLEGVVPCDAESALADCR